MGKLRKLNLDMRGLYTGTCRLVAGAFYPELAQVGKGLIGEERRAIIGVAGRLGHTHAQLSKEPEKVLAFPQRPGDVARSLNMLRRTLYRGPLAHDLTT
jgi:hypothetical protein